VSLTVQQIIQLACQKANAPAYVTQAGYEINLILQELAQRYSWVTAQGFLSGTFTQGIGGTANVSAVVTGSGPYPMPANFLRMRFGDFFWVNGGINYFPTPVDMQDYDSLVQQPGFTSYPTAFAIDMSTTPPGLYVWPAPSGAYPFFGRYDSQQADMETPDISLAVPWFPSQAFLMDKLTAAMCKYSGDKRKGDFDTEAELTLKRYMEKEGNTDNRANTVKLDPRFFGPQWQQLPGTKAVPWALLICAIISAAGS
jgi:hypothetical protein